jgi:hypothetical protein
MREETAAEADRAARRRGRVMVALVPFVEGMV